MHASRFRSSSRRVLEPSPSPCPLCAVTTPRPSSLNPSKRSSASRPSSTNILISSREDREGRGGAKLSPPMTLNAFRGVYLAHGPGTQSTQQDKGGDTSPRPRDRGTRLRVRPLPRTQPMIDYDYIMALLARFSQAKTLGKKQSTMNREQLIGLIQAGVKFLGRTRHHHRLRPHASRAGWMPGRNLKSATGYQRFKAERLATAEDSPPWRRNTA